MKEQVVAVALFALLAVIGYFLTWGEWTGPLPPGIGPPAGWRRATLPATYAIDLESGAVRDSAESARDLWWEARTQTEFCLCPYRVNDRSALMAPVPAAEFESLGADRAATLQYSADGFSLGNQAGEPFPGFGFVVRTSEGNFAKVRVRNVSANRALTLDWRMLGPGTVASVEAGNPSIESRRLLAEVRANLRGGKDRERASVLLDAALSLADKYPASGAERVALLNEIGQLYWSARRPDMALAVYTRAATEIAGHDTTPGTGTLDWKIPQQTYWWLGTLSRDGGRYAEAVPWLERSLAAARTAMTRDHNEESTRRMAITSALNELYLLECRAGKAPAAAARLQELQDTCAAMLPDSLSHGACNERRIRC